MKNKNSHCENCGERVYELGCVNCDEIKYIARQYEDMDMEVPGSIINEINKKNKE